MGSNKLILLSKQNDVILCEQNDVSREHECIVNNLFHKFVQPKELNQKPTYKKEFNHTNKLEYVYGDYVDNKTKSVSVHVFIS